MTLPFQDFHFSRFWSFNNSSRCQYMQRLMVLISRGSNWDFCGQMLPCHPLNYRFVVPLAISLYCLRQIQLMKCRPIHVSIHPNSANFANTLLPPCLSSHSKPCTSFITNDRTHKMSYQTYPNSYFLHREGNQDHKMFHQQSEYNP